MSPDWRFCLKIGTAIVVADLLTLALVQNLPPDSDQRVLLETIDEIVNVMLFAFVGFRTGRETGRATSAAEAGVATSALPALVAAAYQIVGPNLDSTGADVTPLVNRVVASVAFNIVLGGLSAWFSGWLASRGRSAVR